jgi:mono/diheme cytochrome c family protein
MINRKFTAKILITGLFLSLGLTVVLTSRGEFGTVTVEAQRGGSAIYAQNCARCHGADGRAQTPKGRETDAIDLTSDDWSPDAARDTRIVTRGKGSMPGFGRKLTPAQVSAVVQYIRRFKR